MTHPSLPVWYWLVVTVWAVALIFALAFFGRRGGIYLLMVLLVSRPPIGLALLLSGMAPALALPFAIRRNRLVTE